MPIQVPMAHNPKPLFKKKPLWHTDGENLILVIPLVPLKDCPFTRNGNSRLFYSSKGVKNIRLKGFEKLKYTINIFIPNKFVEDAEGTK